MDKNYKSYIRYCTRCCCLAAMSFVSRSCADKRKSSTNRYHNSKVEDVLPSFIFTNDTVLQDSCFERFFSFLKRYRVWQKSLPQNDFIKEYNVNM